MHDVGTPDKPEEPTKIGDIRESRLLSGAERMEPHATSARQVAPRLRFRGTRDVDQPAVGIEVTDEVDDMPRDAPVGRIQGQEQASRGR